METASRGCALGLGLLGLVPAVRELLPGGSVLSREDRTVAQKIVTFSLSALLIFGAIVAAGGLQVKDWAAGCCNNDDAMRFALYKPDCGGFASLSAEKADEMGQRWMGAIRRYDKSLGRNDEELHAQFVRCMNLRK